MHMYLSSKVPGVECDAAKLLGSLPLLLEVFWLQILAVLPYAKVHPNGREGCCTKQQRQNW